MPEWLQREIGPFPVWQWLVIVIGGIALSLIVQRSIGGRSSSRNAPALTDPTQSPYAGTQATGGPGVVYTTPDTGAGSVPEPGSGRATTNREWLAQASSLVGALGLHQPVEVDTALRRYLQGQELGVGALAIVNDALNYAGPPPEGAPPIIREDAIPSDPGPTSSLPDGRFTVDAPAEAIGIYTIDNELVRVGGSDRTDARRLSEYGSAGGVDSIIDSLADVRFVEQARGVKRDDPGTARMILDGSFGPVAASFRPTLQRIAEG